MTPGDGKHNCPWPGCSARVDRGLWGCAPHWSMLPPTIRRRIYGAWRHGTFSQHMATLEEADEWIAAFLEEMTSPPGAAATS